MAITLQQLRRYHLTRQALLERQATGLGAFGVLHGTDHATPYLSLLARLEPFNWQDFATALNQGHMHRLRCMRGTVHLVEEGLYDLIACIYQADENTAATEFEMYGISLEEAQELRFFLQEALQLHGSQSPQTIKKFIDPKLIRQYTHKYGTITNVAPVMRWMWALGLLETGRPVHNWRNKPEKYSLNTRPVANCNKADFPKAVIQLARHYFSTYAPAAVGDWLWWSGLKASEARPAFKALEAELVSVEVEGISEPLWAFPAEAEALQATPNELPAMVRLLPYEDALLKAYKPTRYRFYDDEGLAEEIAITGGGEARPTLWLNGQIIGVWTWGRKAGETIVLEPFVHLNKEQHRHMKPEIERVQAFLEAKTVLWAD